MQDRYAADIGDYVKLALLRHLSDGRRLGVAWYLCPDQEHSSDGKHITYLKKRALWRHLDVDLFDALSLVAATGRSVAALQAAGVLEATYTGERLISADLKISERDLWRKQWFQRVLTDLNHCDLVFADPDNGLVNDRPERRRQTQFGKQIPIEEAKALARDRTAVIYHHNTRFKGGQNAEVDHWLHLLGDDVIAVRANAYNCRTFFIVSPDDEIRKRAASFCERWSGHQVRFVDRQH